MSILSAQKLAKYYGAQDVFAKVSLSVAHGDKIALVGPNGAGKTTLLRILIGLEEPTSGDVFRSRRLRIGYLPQQAEFPSQQTLYAEMLDVFSELREREQALLELMKQMAVTPDPTELMARYAKAEQRFEFAGGYEYENRIRRVLSGLGFGPDTYDWPISLLSGGQVTRALLAKLLLQEPQLLVLDEPSNHLDLDALEWLESYLQDWTQSMLVVSHDRYFLDKVASRVWELDHGELQIYRGNYSHFVLQRQERRRDLEREYKAQQSFIAKTEEFIRRYKAGQRSKEARGREKRLNRLERIEPLRRDRRISLRLSTSLRSGDNVLMSDGAMIGYETRPDAVSPGAVGQTDGEIAETKRLVLFDTGEFLIQRRDRVALMGPNGSGKTTFLRTILAQVAPLSGQIRVGASVRLGYLPQEQDWLDSSRTVLEQILDVSDLTIAESRHLLGQFLFSGDDVYKSVGDLSGGELSRLALAVLTIKGANVLLLDEPTTHLDVASQEILQDVLTSFKGTILFVSHDRYLIDALATHVWDIRDGRLQQVEGNYSQYLATYPSERQRAASPGAAKSQSLRDSDVPVADSDVPVADPDVPVAERNEQRRRQREIQRLRRTHRRRARQGAERLAALEMEIDRIEERLDAMTGLIDRASAARDLGRVHALGSEYQQLQAVLAERLDEWEETASLRHGS